MLDISQLLILNCYIRYFSNCVFFKLDLNTGALIGTVKAIVSANVSSNNATQTTYYSNGVIYFHVVSLASGMK